MHQIGSSLRLNHLNRLDRLNCLNRLAVSGIQKHTNSCDTTSPVCNYETAKSVGQDLSASLDVTRVIALRNMQATCMRYENRHVMCQQVGAVLPLDRCSHRCSMRTAAAA